MPQSGGEEGEVGSYLDKCLRLGVARLSVVSKCRCMHLLCGKGSWGGQCSELSPTTLGVGGKGNGEEGSQPPSTTRRAGT